MWKVSVLAACVASGWHGKTLLCHGHDVVSLEPSFCWTRRHVSIILFYVEDIYPDSQICQERVSQMCVTYYIGRTLTATKHGLPFRVMSAEI